MRTAHIAVYLFVIALVWAYRSSAEAACTLPNTITNGQVTDATQVMANFNAVMTCLENNGSVNTGSSGQIAYYGQSGNAVLGESVSDLLDSTFGSTQGSVLYRGSTGWTALGPGVAGQVLKSGGPGADPSWGSPIGSLGAVPYLGATGGAWMRPAGISFTWVNQGTSIYTDNTGGGPLVMKVLPHSGDNLSLLCTSAPTAPYTYTVMATSPALASSDYTAIGVALYDSGSGKIETLGFGYNFADVIHWTSVTAWSSTPKSIPVYGNLLWMRVQNDGSTLTYSISTDDLQWLVLTSESVTAFLPAITNVCWGANAHDNGSSQLPVYAELWQWTSP